MLSALVALAVCAAPAAAAPSPTVRDVVLGGHLYPKPFGDTYVYGQVRVPASEPATDQAGQTVALYASAFPFTDWVPVATMTTDFKGYFSYHATINQNMTYRAIWQTTPPVQSKDKLVKLPLKLSLKASHTRVKKNGVVTFKGNGHPAHPGATVQLQQEDSHGGFKTFAKGTLSPGSKFSVRTRVRRGGVFRALFAGDGQYGVSASRALRVSTR